MKSQILTSVITVGAAMFGLPSYAQSTIEDSTSVGNDSLQVIPDTLQQLSEQVAQNGQAIADMRHVTGLYGLLIIVLAIMLIICMLILGLIVYGKLKKNKHHDDRPLRKELDELKDDVSWKIRQNSNSIDAIKGELSSIRHTMSTLLSQNDFVETRRVATKQQSQQDYPAQQVQYLKAEKNDGFFFEGDSKNSDGCQFKVTFYSKTNGSRGELQVITDLDNLKSIPSDFLRLVIRKTNNVTIKEATSMTMIHPGICEYIQENGFGTWRITKPIDIKLNK